MIALDSIRQIANLLAEHFEPERIILFGSHARGEAHANSDIDLLVEMPAGYKPPSRGNPMRMAIAERFTLPVDVVIRSADQMQLRGESPYALEHFALQEGVVLYDKHAA